MLQCVAVNATHSHTLQHTTTYCNKIVATVPAGLQLLLLSQRVAVYRSVLQCVAVYRSVLQRVAVYRSVLQCVVVRSSVLQCVVVRSRAL